MERVTLEDKSECMMHQWWRRGSRFEMHLYLLDLFMEGLDLWWGEHLSEVKGWIWTECLIWRRLQLCNDWRYIRYLSAEEARIYAASLKRKRVCAMKYTQRYTLVCVNGSVYIHDISKGKARMQTRVCWSKGKLWIQCENWWNVVHRGAEGCSLQSGVVAPFQVRLVNEIRGS